ncbi:YwqI/YxiC family protein [Bacillus sp. FJAT-22090]|uniref:YwqI/YxiC family protein n=1 Tax=Bacillus sp. FJAT-22090 TaxID=1581038 RepID=UPI0011A5D97B|nr:YwqI/YxiC family protein [Bacillus sp. FJAT-22090]
MSTEVKIVYADVETQLGEMTNATEMLNPKAEPPITGNTLDVVTKLTELSTKLEQLLTKYQTVLNTNIQTTTSSVEFMKESDEKISSAMQCTIDGPKQVAP